MSFSLPTFNLTCNIWHRPNVPPAAPSLSVVCNLAFGRRVGPVSYNSGSLTMSLLLPPGTDVRTVIETALGNDVIECPAGSKRYYQPLLVDDIGKGFPNEHRFALLQQITNFGLWPIPIP